jgi:hypothetical protein
MKSIQHLPLDEQQHYIQCDCGEYLDMRDLGQVFQHLHSNLPEPEWTYTVRKDQPVAHLKSGRRVDLN